MATRQYIGARYVPKYEGVHDPTRGYEPLSIVADSGLTANYTSIKAVPVGVPLTDQDYWIISGNVNASIATLTARVDALDNKILTIENCVTPEQYGAVGDGVTDDTQAMQDAIDYALLNNKAVYAPGNYLITDSLKIAAVSGNGFLMEFNKIENSAAVPALIVTGSIGSIRGNVLISAGDGIQCGSGTDDGLNGFSFNISQILADNDGYAMRPGVNGNVQYINITGDSLGYGKNGIYMTHSYRYIGEIRVYNIAFGARSSFPGANYAILLENMSNRNTGITLVNCGFEYAKGGVKIDGMSSGHGIDILNMFYVRTSELVNNGYYILEATGSGRINSTTIYCDAFTQSAISIAGTIRPAEIDVYGLLTRGSAKYDHAKFAVDSLLPVLSSALCEPIAANAVINDNTLPNCDALRLGGDAEFDLTRKAFFGELKLLNYGGSAATVRLVGVASNDVTLNAGEMLILKPVFINGQGTRIMCSKAPIDYVMVVA